MEEKRLWMLKYWKEVKNKFEEKEFMDFRHLLPRYN